MIYHGVKKVRNIFTLQWKTKLYAIQNGINSANFKCTPLRDKIVCCHVIGCGSSNCDAMRNNKTEKGWWQKRGAKPMHALIYWKQKWNGEITIQLNYQLISSRLLQFGLKNYVLIILAIFLRQSSQYFLLLLLLIVEKTCCFFLLFIRFSLFYSISL